MATPGVVVTQADEATPNIGELFAGKSFMVAQRVPMRTNFLERIRANGGRIVRIELQADYIIADHVRKDCPPTSLSYTFVEAAIAAGALPDPNHHRAGPAPGTARVVGSTIVPPKGTRTQFTAQDDRDLWMWVQNYQRLGVHGIKGNEIYKQLEAINPRHTFQSWRDHYVKKLMNNPPKGVPLLQDVRFPLVQPASSQVRRPEVDGTVEEEAQDEEEAEDEYSVDVTFLLDNIDDILNIPTEDLDTVWASLADEDVSSHLTADQWKRLYEEEALPAYEAKQKAKQKKEKRAQPSPLKRKARVSTPEPPAPGEEPTTPELIAMREKAARERQASPSVNQKRRRQTATPQANTYGRKRAKADHSAIFTEEQPADNGVGVPDAQASIPAGTPATNDVIDLDLDNGNVNGGNTGELALPGEEPLPTSELNRAAKAQLIAEANSLNIESELPSQPQAQDGIQDTGIEDNETAKAQDDVVPQNGLQLTEENLAHQQEEHGVKLTRASDLRENDENLSNYAEYLQTLVAGHIAKKTAQPQEGENHKMAELDTELESDRELSPAQPTSKTPQVDANVVSADPDNNTPTQVVASNGDFDGPFPSQGGIDADPFGDLPSVNGDLENSVDRAISDQAFAGLVQQGSDEEMGDEVEIDLTLAEPEGGFDFSSQEEAHPDGLAGQYQWEAQQPLPLDQAHMNGGATTTAPDVPIMSEDEDMEEAPAKAIAPRIHTALDTQDIYATGAQQPDFSFPLPPDSDVEEPEPELPADEAKKPAPAPRTTISSRKRPASTTPRRLIPTSTHQEPEAPATESVQSFLARLTADGCAPASLHSAIYRTSAQLQAAEIVAMYEKLGLPAPDIPEVWSAEDDGQVGTTDAGVFKALCEKKGWEEYDFRLKFLQEWKAANQ